MERNRLRQVFGTDEAPPLRRRLRAGDLALDIVEGTVRGLFWRGVEVLRAIDYPIRDPDWGTWQTVTRAESHAETVERLDYTRSFEVEGGALRGEFSCSGTAAGVLTLRLLLTASRAVEVNRAGFVLLHPIAGFAGSPLAVTHSDGSVEHLSFPERIAPVQPVLDISTLLQDANGVAAELRFSGETFEMEDQRNWSDASYKTYCRPLSLPFPYAIAAGTSIEQGISVQLSGSGSASGAGPVTGPLVASAVGEAVVLGPEAGRKLPELALALEAGWESESVGLAQLEPVSTLLRLDLVGEDWSARLPRLLSAALGALDLELVVADERAEIAPALNFLRSLLDQSRIAPRSVTALPRAYLKSYQPQGRWPAGATPREAAAAVRRAFPSAAIGGGMLTNFTELNRCRDAAAVGDFITHGTTAIVHAADDESVIQTLEALPQVFASAESLAPGKPYCLGLIGIGMRSNPYGQAVAPNPTGRRVPMAMADPRQRGLFAAAFMIGVVAATAGSHVERLAAAAPAGPFGLTDGSLVHPAYHAFAALTRLHGRERLTVAAPPGIAAVAVRSLSGAALVLANLGASERRLELPEAMQAVVLAAPEPAADWLSTAPRETLATLHLPAFAMACLSLGPHDLFRAVL